MGECTFRAKIGQNKKNLGVLTNLATFGALGNLIFRLLAHPSPWLLRSASRGSFRRALGLPISADFRQQIAEVCLSLISSKMWYDSGEGRAWEHMRLARQAHALAHSAQFLFRNPWTFATAARNAEPPPSRRSLFLFSQVFSSPTRLSKSLSRALELLPSLLTSLAPKTSLSLYFSARVCGIPLRFRNERSLKCVRKLKFTCDHGVQ